MNMLDKNLNESYSHIPHLLESCLNPDEIVSESIKYGCYYITGIADIVRIIATPDEKSRRDLWWLIYVHCFGMLFGAPEVGNGIDREPFSRLSYLSQVHCGIEKPNSDINDTNNWQTIVNTSKMDLQISNSRDVFYDEGLREKLLYNGLLANAEGNCLDHFIKKLQLRRPSDRFYHNRAKYNTGIRALGVSKFLMTAVQFCENEGSKNSLDVISIGSGDGTLEKEIIAAYRFRFGKDLHITLVDPGPTYETDFKTVDELIEKRPNVVGRCVLLIIWPEPRCRNTNYDIDGIIKLKSRAALTVYEAGTSNSGSEDFQKFLHDQSLELSPSEFGYLNFIAKFFETKGDRFMNYGLNHYSVKELARLKISLPMAGTWIFRMKNQTSRKVTV